MTDNLTTKCIRDGKVAVLYSPGYGAGWSTWAENHSEFLVFDAGLVALAEAHAPEPEVDAYLKTALGEEHGIYLGGWEKIAVQWLTPGYRFEISEYDGNESVRVFGPTEGYVA